MAGRFNEKSVKFLTRRGVKGYLKSSILEAYGEQ
jgi:hypothetical protein